MLRNYLNSAGRRQARWLLVVLLGTAFALRALTPVGYMPGSLADGSAFVLCPGSNPAIAHFLARASGASHHAHGAAADADTATPWEQCVFAAAALAFIPTGPAAAPPPQVAHESAPAARSARPASAHFLSRRARAPPRLTT